MEQEDFSSEVGSSGEEQSDSSDNDEGTDSEAEKTLQVQTTQIYAIITYELCDVFNHSFTICSVLYHNVESCLDFNLINICCFFCRKNNSEILVSGNLVLHVEYWID